jgi:hypothetical protein
MRRRRSGARYFLACFFPRISAMDIEADSEQQKG